MLHEEGDGNSRVHQSVYFVSSQNVCDFLPPAEVLFHRSQVHISVSPNRNDFPRAGHHVCCGRCGECRDCGKCRESGSVGGSPIEMRDVIELFPNTTDLTILWEVSDHGIHSFDPTHSGEKLRHLKRLHVDLRYDVYGLANHFQQANDTKMLLGHLCVPSVESVAIAFEISDYGQGCIDDMKATGNALCEIKAPALKCVTMSVTVPLWQEPIPEAWVSICDILLA